MRLYCLTSIHQLSPEENVIDVVPYEKGAPEHLFIDLDETLTPRNIIKSSASFNSYQLTEICIGYKYLETNKVYVMNLYRKDTNLFLFKMIRGAVRFKKISNDIFDLYIRSSKLYPERLDYDLCIRTRCVKNTEVKGNISEEEEDLYEEYVREIEALCNNNDELFEETLSVLPFVLPNTTRPNVLRQKISDLKKLIYLLCDPKIGNYKNVLPDKRYCQKLNCFLKERNDWEISIARQNIVENQAKNYRQCQFLGWKNVNLQKLPFEKLNTKNVKNIDFQETILFNTKHELCVDFKTLFPNLKGLALYRCFVKELPDSFFEMLPVTLECLSVENNDIKFIPSSISKLEKLDSLWLSESIDDNGFPWIDLPRTISRLHMEKTNITMVPVEISRLNLLHTLSVSSEKLKYVTWNALAPTIVRLTICGKNCINDYDFVNKAVLSDFILRNLKIDVFDSFKFPACTDMLDLRDNKLTFFDSRNESLNLHQILISENNIDTICWENLPNSLQYFHFNHNKIQFIGNILHLINLRCIAAAHNHITYISESICYLQHLNSLCLKNNQLTFLPKGFENLQNLEEMDLSCNKFNYDEHNLEEVLWKRMPPNLKTLCLSKNFLHELPCLLKNYNFQHLIVDDCKLVHICPYLYSETKSQEIFRCLYIDNNPTINFLPFIPQVIYQPQSLKEIFGTNISYNTLVLSSNNDIILHTSRFPTRSNKPFYEFKKIQYETIKCNCCANCGQFTNTDAIEQLMIMDHALRKTPSNLQKNFLIEKDPEALRLSSDREPPISAFIMGTNKVPPKTKYFLPGKWKTSVKTRLCLICQEIIKQRIQESYENYLKLQAEESGALKKRKIILQDTESPALVIQNKINEDSSIQTGTAYTAKQKIITADSQNNGSSDSGTVVDNTYYIFRDLPFQQQIPATWPEQTTCIESNLQILPQQSDIHPAVNQQYFPQVPLVSDEFSPNCAKISNSALFQGQPYYYQEAVSIVPSYDNNESLREDCEIIPQNKECTIPFHCQQINHIQCNEHFQTSHQLQQAGIYQTQPNYTTHLPHINEILPSQNFENNSGHAFYQSNETENAFLQNNWSFF